MYRPRVEEFTLPALEVCALRPAHTQNRSSASPEIGSVPSGSLHADYQIRHGGARGTEPSVKKQ
ncbi:hypothetical protein PtB15_12B137 [Puccinia triticina]|nr:hypothetical protein PtB15_12B137 [Puccinia triticina]